MKLKQSSSFTFPLLNLLTTWSSYYEAVRPNNHLTLLYNDPQISPYDSLTVKIPKQ